MSKEKTYPELVWEGTQDRARFRVVRTSLNAVHFEKQSTDAMGVATWLPATDRYGDEHTRVLVKAVCEMADRVTRAEQHVPPIIAVPGPEAPLAEPTDISPEVLKP